MCKCKDGNLSGLSFTLGTLTDCFPHSCCVTEIFPTRKFCYSFGFTVSNFCWTISSNNFFKFNATYFNRSWILVVLYFKITNFHLPSSNNICIVQNFSVVDVKPSGWKGKNYHCGRNEGSCGSGDLDPLFLNFCARWRLMVPSQLIRWQDGTKCRSGRSGEEKCNYVFTASCTSRLAFYIDWVIPDFSVKSIVLMCRSCRFWRFAFFVSSFCCSTKLQTSLVYISCTFLHTRTVRFVHFTWFSLMYQILNFT